jgi:uncharacterized membrane protein
LAGTAAFSRSRLNCRLGGAEVDPDFGKDHPVFGNAVGYVQHVDVESLQDLACQHNVRISLSVVPGVFAAPDRAHAYINLDEDAECSIDKAEVAAAFNIGQNRVYDDDPCFALVALSEIASTALSPVVNDPGTAIGILGSFIRLFDIFSKPLSGDEQRDVRYDRALVPEISVDEMLDDAFRAIPRDGARVVEVQIRLQKALAAIATIPNAEIGKAARLQAHHALERARQGLQYQPDIDLVVDAAEWSR